MRKKIPSIIIYIMSLILLMIPWLPVGEAKYNIIGMTMRVFHDGGETLANEAEIIIADAASALSIQVILPTQLVLYLLYFLCAIIYIVSILGGKKWRINLANILFAVVNLFTYGMGMGISLFGAGSFSVAIVPLILTLLTGIEIPICLISERWDEVVEESQRYEAEEKAQKEEERERLRFDGKYTKQFYKIVWKNFRKNWKDYLLLLICNIVICICLVVGYGVQNILSNGYEQQGVQLFDELDTIVMNAMIPMGILSVFIIVILFFYYIKCRARNYGVFLTLGMRRKTLYYFVALEYCSVLLIALVTGGLIGSGILFGFVQKSEQFMGTAITFSAVGILPYVKAVGTILTITMISLMATRDIFRDFRVGKSEDARAVGEKMPMSFRKGFLGIGVAFCAIAIFRYSNLDNFENVYLLVVFFIGLFLILRYGMAEYLLRERKQAGYLKKLLLHNQLFHKSKTNAGYMVVLVVIQFCVVFYFSFQLIAANIAEEADALYPYDVICLADESDDEYFAELKEKYELELYEYPALRVSAYDSTSESEGRGVKPVQGQHIGISESTYHALKKYIDPSYEAEPLGLDADKRDVYIVYQQDQSVEAHPIEYSFPRSTPMLHVGLPCKSVDTVSQRENRYNLYRVKGEEIGSLTGVFRQGNRENLVVFSDEYFETAKDFWETTNIYNGEYIENEEERIPDVTTFQGITKLVLMNAAEEDMESLSEELEVFEQKHLDEEDEVYGNAYLGTRGIYDLSVSYHYIKTDSMKNLTRERVMKVTMNVLLIVLFFVMNLILVLIKMLSEMDFNRRRAEFLNRMGMRKKDRIRLVKKEVSRYFYLLPISISVVFAGIFTIIVFHARMYTKLNVFAYLKIMFPVWGIYLSALTVAMWTMSTIYAYRVEGRKDGRSS